MEVCVFRDRSWNSRRRLGEFEDWLLIALISELWGWESSGNSRVVANKIASTLIVDVIACSLRH